MSLQLPLWCRVLGRLMLIWQALPLLLPVVGPPLEPPLQACPHHRHHRLLQIGASAVADLRRAFLPAAWVWDGELVSLVVCSVDL